MMDTQVPKDEHVYALTNAAEGNSVAVFTRMADGTLTPLGTLVPFSDLPPGVAEFFYRPSAAFSTDGLGTGVPFNSQGALAVSDDGHYLFAVNGGSNEITSFAVTGTGLRLVSTVSSGGVGPRSLTVHDDLLYVVNGFGLGTVQGFRIRPNGALTPLAGSHRELGSAGSEPVQVSFHPDGTLLVVSELFADRISVFQIGTDGLPGSVTENPSAGASPFGFAFNQRGQVIVSEAFGFKENASAVSSYAMSPSGELSVISASVPTCQTATCWLVNTPDGRYTYASNTGSGSITGYRIGADGSLTALNADGRTGVTGAVSLPIDMVIGGAGTHLYVLNQGAQTIAAFRIGDDGSLTLLPSVGNLPPVALGLAIHSSA